MTLAEASKIVRAYNRQIAGDVWCNVRAVVTYEGAGEYLPWLMHKETGAIVRQLKDIGE
jgi:hypothetical protein